MVDFISWEKAKELAHAEPVAFVEIVDVRYAAIRRAEDRWPPPWA